jgi:uncharacterized protein (TIGR03086 family)
VTLAPAVRQDARVTDLPAIVADYGRAHAATRRLIQGLRPEQWSAGTPCTEWDVHVLVGHLVGGDRMFAALASGDAPTLEVAIARRQASDPLGDDPLAAFDAAAAVVRATFCAPGCLEATHPSPLGDQTGEFMLHVRINEHLVHGWDLARCTRQSVDVLPADLAERGLAMWRQALPAGVREPGGRFASEQPAPEGAPAIDQLAAYLGRTV